MGCRLEQVLVSAGYRDREKLERSGSHLNKNVVSFPAASIGPELACGKTHASSG
jgi:hypothetical protein